MIIKTVAEHQETLLSIIANSGQFDESGLAHVKDTLAQHFIHPDEAIWLTAMDKVPVGVAYCAPEPVTSGTWNLLMLWMEDGFEGRGFGRQLITEVENQLKHRQARLLIVETSQLPDFEPARIFYEKYGFVKEAQVKNFFNDGDDKLIYTKSLMQR